MYTLNFTNVNSMSLPNNYAVPSFVLNKSEFANWRERTYWLVVRKEKKHEPKNSNLFVSVIHDFQADQAVGIIRIRECFELGELLFMAFDVRFIDYDDIWEQEAANLRRWGLEYLLYHPFANYVVSYQGMRLQNELF